MTIIVSVSSSSSFPAPAIAASSSTVAAAAVVVETTTQQSVRTIHSATTNDNDNQQDRYAAVDAASINTEVGPNLSILPSASTDKSVTTQDRVAMHISSNVSGFVTFLKAMFGMSLLSSPQILDHTGPVLGTLMYVVIISACTFSCYLLLEARSTIVRLTSSNSSSKSRRRRRRHNQQQQEKVVSYGVLGRKLLGKKYSPLMTFLIVTLHMLFGAHMASASGNMLAEAWNTYYYKEAENAPDHQNEFEESDMMSSSYYQWKLMLLLFPFVTMLLQFKNMYHLFVICSAGLLIYLLGCVGTVVFAGVAEYIYFRQNDGNGTSTTNEEMYYFATQDDDYFYSNYTNSTANNFTSSSAYFIHRYWNDAFNFDLPDDIWTNWNFWGIPEFVASTVCAVEGINLAIPTANSLNNPQESAFPVVSAVIIFYGILTLMGAWMGYLGGLGINSNNTDGDEWDDNGEDNCSNRPDECLLTDLLSQIYQVSLGIALLFTMPVILYPSLEMLQVWADEQWWYRQTSGSNNKNKNPTGTTPMRYQWKTLVAALIVPRQGSVTHLLDYYSEKYSDEDKNNNNNLQNATNNDNNNNLDEEHQINTNNEHDNNNEEELPRYYMLEDEINMNDSDINKDEKQDDKGGDFLPTASMNRILHSSANTAVHNNIDNHNNGIINHGSSGSSNNNLSSFPTTNTATNQENLLLAKQYMEKYMDDDFQNTYRKKRKKLKYPSRQQQQQESLITSSGMDIIQKKNSNHCCSPNFFSRCFCFQFHRHWRLRVFHAFVVCILGALEKDFEDSFTFFKGIGLSIAGFVLPCILYYYANIRSTQNFLSLRLPMKIVILCLLTLGLTNIMLVCISSFTKYRLLPVGFHEHIASEEETKFVYWKNSNLQ